MLWAISATSLLHVCIFSFQSPRICLFLRSCLGPSLMVLVRALYVCFNVCPDLQKLCEILEFETM